MGFYSNEQPFPQSEKASPCRPRKGCPIMEGERTVSVKEEKPSSSTPPELELVFDVTQDIESLNTFFQNLEVGALELLIQGDFPLRSRYVIRATHPQKEEEVQFQGEVISIKPKRVAFQILNLTPEIQQALQQLISQPPTRTSSEKNSTASSAQPALSPISFEREGRLRFHLPTVLRHIFDEANDLGFEPRTRFLEGTLLGLVTDIARLQVSGALICQANDSSTTIYFNDGQIVGAEKKPQNETDSVAYLMRKAGKLTETQYRKIREERDATEKTDSILLASNENKKMLAKIIRQVIYRNLGQTFAWPETQYSFLEGKNHLKKILLVPVSFRRALFRGIIEAAASYPTDELRHGLDPYMTHFVSKPETLPFDPSLLKLSEQEQRFLEVTLDKPVRLRRLFAISALSRIQSLRALYSFYFLGFLTFLTNYQPEPEDVLPHLTQTLEEFRGIDLFEILHIHWAALPDEIENAYQRLQKEWKALNIPPSEKSQGEPLRQSILKEIADAYRVLSDNSERQRYRKEIIGDSQRKFSADLLAQHARTDLYRKEHKRALRHIEQALDLDASNASYRQLRDEIKKAI